MLQVLSSLKGYAIEASDGALGTVSDALFDDTTWKMRWLVVDTGRWLTGRKVLLHPSSITRLDHARQELGVALTKAQVSGSPDILQDRPVSRQMQSDLYGYYGWDPYWGGGMYGSGLYAEGLYGGGLGVLPFPAAGIGAVSRDDAAEHGDTAVDEGDPHLRSAAELTGYHIHARDGGIGHVENLLIDSEGWGIRYLIVDTSNWWIGRHVLISPYAVTSIDWLDQQIRLDLGRDQVKASPPWDPAEIISEAYERRLHGYYNWPGYGW
ncbi:MAG: PRC-barrel domain containing protein [Janthinobacterium lividum]